MRELKILALQVGALATNCYIIDDGENCAVVDPGARGKNVREAIASTGCPLVYILLTHGHFDHIGAVAEVKSEWPGARIVINVADSRMLTSARLNYSDGIGAPVTSPAADTILIDGDTLPFGCRTIKMLHTPGHSPGSCCYLIDDALFCGDTIFYGDVGRTDLHGGSESDLAASLERIETLPADTRLFPGHGRQTDLRREMLCNRYLQ